MAIAECLIGLYAFPSVARLLLTSLKEAERLAIMSKEKSINIRVDDSWTKDLRELLDKLGLPKRFRSRYLRDLVLNEHSRWFFESYTCHQCTCYSLVMADGTVVYWLVQKLLLLTGTSVLPAGVFMKPEKKNYFEFRFRNSPDVARAIRDSWLINSLSAWEGDDIGYGDENRLAVFVDRDGITSKWGKLLVNRPPNTVITREVMVVVRDYAQRGGRRGPMVWELSNDRVDIPIDMPTVDLDFWLLVDLGLYENEPQRRARAMIQPELRNREFGKFQEIDRHSAAWNPLSCDTGRIEGSKIRRASKAKQIRQLYRELERRIRYLSSDSTVADDGRPVVDCAQTRDELQSLATPEDFIYGHLTWPIPRQGLTVSLSYDRRFA